MQENNRDKRKGLKRIKI